jgi:fructose-specific phosphotransferase system IIC component
VNAYGQELPEGTIEQLPEKVRYVRDHIDQPAMQAIVAMSVIGGFGVAAMFVRGALTEAQTEDERIAQRNTIKFLGGAIVAYAAFQLWDIDKRWWSVEKASQELEKVIEGHL